MSSRKMDEKTEELRDIFLSMSDEEAVTESQSDDRGSLTDDADSLEAQLREGIEQLREKFGFEAELTDEKRCALIEGFYEEDSDDELAARVDVDPETVFRARMDLHLVRDEEPTLDEATLERLRESPERDPGEIAEKTDRTAETIRRGRAVMETEQRSRRVSHRFRTLFEETVTDVELTDQLAADAQDDGLSGATEGAETEVDF